MEVNKTLMLNIDHNITIGKNESIEMVVEHMVCLYIAKSGGIGVDIEFVDVKDVKFLGMPIEEGYNGFKKFKDQMFELGIDINELIDEECVGIISSEDIESFKEIFKKILIFKHKKDKLNKHKN